MTQATSVERGRLQPTRYPQSAHQVSFAVPATGVFVTATWGRDQPTIHAILANARLAGTAPLRPQAAKPPADLKSTPLLPAANAGTFTGLGFDACTAPSITTMSAWRNSSPYSAIGIYIGGQNRGCAQANLSSYWVALEIAAGWRLIPTYVGLQAPTSSCAECTSIIPSQAAPEGAAAADDAVTQARGLGLSPGNTIYFDMEGYLPGPSSSPAVLGSWPPGHRDCMPTATSQASTAAPPPA